ncbi:uncharacterized protein LOC134444346 [Engraulis encrasicolus]|uniref:uncharacterized protein LOC134444346 n=1 Tax=Engraulis encrasicolus TaxID=184585 RepID=UPI002FD69BB7
MSAWNGSSARFDRVREGGPHYDQVPIGSLARDAELALSADPLPPPPLPMMAPVGSEFYPPSDTEDNDNQHDDAMDIKPVHRFIPDSVKNFFRGSKRWSSRSTAAADDKNRTSDGVRCSPPPSPGIPGSYIDPFGGSGGSYTSQKEREAMLLEGLPPESVSGVSGRTAMTYSERIEEYNQRYAYMKSWAGLLRILGCVELLLGAAVFACVCAYVHKDNEWFNMFGYSQPGMGIGGMGGGAMGGMYGGSSEQYTGPKTPFVLVVAGLAWVVTVILLVLGMTMYYRTILLDSSWWPITEGVLNFCLAMLYMAGGIMYVRDTTRGGLCNYHVFNNGPNAAFCRTEAGQTAAIIFLFVNMVVYLLGAAVCLKLWRHEASRMRREALAQEMKTTASVPFGLTGPGSSVSEPVRQAMLNVELDDRAFSPAPTIEPEIIRGHIPAGHIPKPVIIADYVAKYPSIYSDEERDQYKAVFNDQYAEYKELHAEVEVVIKKFEEMDNMMHNLRPSSQMEQERINVVIQEYQRKKMDPTFVEKKERCEYLKSKLAHIKQKIYEYEHPPYGVILGDRGQVLLFLRLRKVLGGGEGYSLLDKTNRPKEVPTMPSNKHSSSPYGHRHHGSRNKSQHTFSGYYPDEKLLHFYKWTSPPGVMKIMSIIIIVMCVAVFACVASTLAWDYDMSAMGLGGIGGGMTGGYYGGGSYGGSYGGSVGSAGYGGGAGMGGYGYGGGQYMDPKSGKAFIIAIAAITFIAVLIIFILVVSRQGTARSHKFYLGAIIVSAILALLMLIATIVYLVAVNPRAQSSGSIMYSQVMMMCAQFQNQQPTSGLVINQYLYHYCVVEPQEAIAIVLGFLIVVGLIILLVFGVKTRSQIRRYGPERVLWEEVKMLRDVGPQSVGEWVKSVSGEPEALVNDYNDKVGGSRNYLDESVDRKPIYLPGSSDITSSLGGLKSKLKESDLGAESGDELDDLDLGSEYPPIATEEQRLHYKREFDRDLMEYKRLQAEVDDVNLGLSEVDKELGRVPEGSPQFLDAMDEYTRLKNLKKSAEYQLKKKRSKYLRAKLSHVKRMVSQYDNRP